MYAEENFWEIIKGIFEICHGSGVMQQKVGLGVNLPPYPDSMFVNEIENGQRTFTNLSRTTEQDLLSRSG